MENLSNLHLVGARYKNYRNFKDEYIELSSKYSFFVKDRVVKKDYDNGTGNIELHIDKLEINLRESFNNESNISYMCVVGKNGTGKTTLMQLRDYSNYDQILYRKGSISLFYKVFIDEITEHIYILHNYNDFFDKLVFLEKIMNMDIKLLNIDNSSSLNVINFLDSSNGFIFSQNNLKSQLDIIRKLQISSYDLALEISLFDEEFGMTFNDEAKKYEKEILNISNNMEEEFESFLKYTLIYLYISPNTSYEGNGDLEEIYSMNYLNLSNDEIVAFKKILKNIHSLFLINDKEMIVRKNRDFLENLYGSYAKPSKYKFNFFINRQNLDLKIYENIQNIILNIDEFNIRNRKNQFLHCILETNLTNTSSGERHTIELLADINCEIIEKIKSIIEENSCNSINIILNIDEPDKNMHPEWARKFRYLLDELLENIINEYAKKEIDVHFQVIISTHSPFMVSDYKKNELLMLGFEDDRIYSHVIPTEKSFFGANIYDIIKDSFFLENSIGEYAKIQIEKAIKELTSKETISDERLEEIKCLKEEISDLFIKDTLDRLIINYEVLNDN